MKLNPKLTIQPRKIRRQLYNLPQHKRLKMMVAPLTKEARERYGIKRIQIRKGDTVIIRKGRFKGVVGKVIKVIPKEFKIHVEGANLKRAGGSVVHYPIYVYNVAIMELDLTDPKRKKIIERKQKIHKELKEKEEIEITGESGEEEKEEKEGE